MCIRDRPLNVELWLPTSSTRVVALRQEEDGVTEQNKMVSLVGRVQLKTYATLKNKISEILEGLIQDFMTAMKHRINEQFDADEDACYIPEDEGTDLIDLALPRRAFLRNPDLSSIVFSAYLPQDDKKESAAIAKLNSLLSWDTSDTVSQEEKQSRRYRLSKGGAQSSKATKPNPKAAKEEETKTTKREVTTAANVGAPKTTSPATAPPSGNEDSGSENKNKELIKYFAFIGLIVGICLLRFVMNQVGASISYVVISDQSKVCLLYTSPSPRDGLLSRMPSSA
eukprot:TRINITY_DN8150_c0_g1_i3.p1 TRINITY_DN8150_c0_g1~~TRINITY_DN8150_c0_g1_i3.p1  ORF type:complete len:283 (-),score=55.81 TRINITY_DN8150_c0_g1_i3:22-870(-)